MNYTTLISVAELARDLADPSLVVFDCRHELTNPAFGGRAYGESHIPGARFANVDQDLSGPLTGSNGRHPLPDPARLVDWLGRMGVSNASQVVGYDQAGGAYSARLWWLLRWVGHEKVAVLDGGWQAWLAAGHAVTQAVPSPHAARFTGTPDDSARVDAKFVQGRLNSPDMVLVDARANDRFHGQNETIDPVAGHIPGAVNRFFKDNLDAQGRFRKPEELRAAFAPLVGQLPATKVVHQCGSGITACHNLFAMEVAGIRGSKLYPGSWSEWIADPSRPIAK
jgi:thiosulfate/3-mercaptopyruvate sulfurtransferase